MPLFLVITSGKLTERDALVSQTFKLEVLGSFGFSALAASG